MSIIISLANALNSVGPCAGYSRENNSIKRKLQPIYVTYLSSIKQLQNIRRRMAIATASIEPSSVCMAVLNISSLW